METREVDVVVIGAGPVGENVADRAVQGGLTVAIVEAELIGGECSYWACMPSKALLRPGAALRAAEAVGVVGGRLDPTAVLERRDGFVSGWDDAGQAEWLDSAGIALVRGHGRLVGERTVRVSRETHTDSASPSAHDVEVTARQAVVVATGSEPVLPDVPGLAETRPWTSREATSVEKVPESLAIIGGGVVAAEAATWFADLGSRVTVLSRSELLRGFEPFTGEAVADALRERGVDVREGVDVSSVARGDDGVTVTLEDGEDVTADELLVAAGRRPRLGDVGLDRVDLESASLEVDDSLRVNGVDWLYVVGDANSRAPVTHQGKYQARIAGDAIAARAHGDPLDTGSWGVHAATADHVAVPQVVFTDPEVASVGITAAQAEETGRRHRIVEYDLGGVAGAALHADGYAGTVRAIVDEERCVLVGLTLVGPGVGELVHAATIAIVGEVPLERLWHAVPSYPTIAEFWLRLLEEYGL